jgi:hypothetical protein
MDLVIRRIIANIIDHLIVAIPTLVIGIILFVFAVIFRVLFWFLPWNFMLDKPLWFFGGSVSIFYIAYETIALRTMKTTFGKKIMNLQVRAVDGQLDGWTCLLRSTLKEIIFGPLIFPIGFLSIFYILMSDPHSSFHDIAARTRIW